jgi:hypothetical protein
MRRSIWRIAQWFLAAVSVIGLGSNGCDRYVPSASELSGEWVGRNEGSSLPAAVRARMVHVSLRADGSFAAVAVLDRRNRQAIDTFDGSGKWRIETGKGALVELEFTSHNCTTARGLRIFQRFRVTGRGANTRLIYEWDPDDFGVTSLSRNAS